MPGTNKWLPPSNIIMGPKPRHAYAQRALRPATVAIRKNRALLTDGISVSVSRSLSLSLPLTRSL
eukprot:10977221-Lingulodinium_polyedra.AAC.1